MTNVLSLVQLRKQRRITYDSEKEPAFNVHFQNGVTMKFREHGEDIYSYAPPHLHHDRPTNTSYQFPQTVEDNTSMYSDRQVLRAKRARDLLHAIGCPSVADLKKVLKMNSISNCPVTEEDVQLAEKVFGPDVSSLKGKSVRRQPKPVMSDVISVPKELVEKHEHVELSLDVIHVNQIPFLVSISKNIIYRTADFLPARTQQWHRKILDKTLGLYNAAGYQITRIDCDQEFEPVMEPVKRQLGIKMNYATTGEHVPDIERSNRTLKERCRSVFYSLPYARIPRLMIRHLVEGCQRAG